MHQCLYLNVLICKLLCMREFDRRCHNPLPHERLHGGNTSRRRHGGKIVSWLAEQARAKKITKSIRNPPTAGDPCMREWGLSPWRNAWRWAAEVREERTDRRRIGWQGGKTVPWQRGTSSELFTPMITPKAAMRCRVGVRNWAVRHFTL